MYSLYNYAGGAADSSEDARVCPRSLPVTSAPGFDPALRVLITVPLVIVGGPPDSTTMARPGVSARQEGPAVVGATYPGSSGSPRFAASYTFNASFSGRVERVLTLAKSIIYTISDMAKFWFGLT